MIPLAFRTRVVPTATSILLFAASSITFAQAQPESKHTTHIDQPVTVPMSTDHGKPSVEIRINGQGPFRFLLDTGASPALVINDDLVRELELETRPGERIGDPANPQAIQTVEVELGEVMIGDGAIFRNVTAVSWDRSALYSGDDAPRGIVGFGLFTDSLLTLDYPRKQVQIELGELPDANGKTIVEFERDRGIPMVPISIDGQSHLAHIDSGSMAALMLPMAMADSLPLQDKPTLVGQGRTVANDFEIYEATLESSVTFGGTNITNPRVMFNTKFDNMVNVGSGILSHYRMTFDQQHDRVRFELGREFNEDSAVGVKKRRSYGLMMNPRAEPLTILNLVENGVAEQAGLQPGDVILSINGTPSSELGMGNLAQEFRKETLVLVVERDGVEHEFSMSLGDDEEGEDG